MFKEKKLREENLGLYLVHLISKNTYVNVSYILLHW